MFGDCDISLPRDIGEGSFRAINNRGDVRIIELDQDKLTYHGILAGAPRRDLYVMDDEAARWYFVRQRSAPRTEIAKKPTEREILDRSPSRSNSAAGAGIFDIVVGRVLGTDGAQTTGLVIVVRDWARTAWERLATEWIALLRHTGTWAFDWIHAPHDTAEPASRIATEPGQNARW
jgi:hypothetical protein